MTNNPNGVYTPRDKNLPRLNNFHYRIGSCYDLTPLEYNEMYLGQRGMCKICFRRFNSELTPVVDHDHKSGKVRGLLCRDCNLGLGYFDDCVWVLERAIEYLGEQSVFIPSEILDKILPKLEEYSKNGLGEKFGVKIDIDNGDVNLLI